MIYADQRGAKRRLTWEQSTYLDTAARQFDYGWGGLVGTQSVRLLEQRGLIMVSWRAGVDGRWRVTGRTALGDAVLERWKELMEAER